MDSGERGEEFTNQNRLNEVNLGNQEKEVQNGDVAGSSNNLPSDMSKDNPQEHNPQPASCTKCGMAGHNPQNCPSPVVCERCKREGHTDRVCTEKKSWECVAPYCGLAAPGQGFFFIEIEKSDLGIKDMSNFALITILSGDVTARQIENEFKMKARPQST